MKKLRTAIIGSGFMGKVHAEAIRRLGNVELAAIAVGPGIDAAAVSKSFGVERVTSNWEEIINDATIDAVHVLTPNALHAPMSIAAMKAGRAVLCEKPVATTSAEAAEMVKVAEQTGVANAVNHNLRYYPVLQHIRQMIAAGELGDVLVVQGTYSQDWLLYDTDYSWRLEPEKGGESSAMGDIGSHWCDLAQHVSGLRITHVLADLATVIPVRKRPLGSRNAFARGSADDQVELVDIKVEDLCSVLVRFEGGVRGAFSVGQICAGHKNDLMLEVNGAAASLRWHQEQQNELWIGHRSSGNVILQKDPSLMDPSVAGMAKLPGGHQEAWPDAFRNILAAAYEHIAEGRPMSEASPMMATFRDGWRANAIIDAVLTSHRNGNVWTEVPS